MRVPSCATKWVISITRFGATEYVWSSWAKGSWITRDYAQGAPAIVRSMYIWNRHMLTDVRSLRRLHSGPRQLIVPYMSIAQLRLFSVSPWVLMAYGLRKWSPENILASDRQFLYDGLIMCSTNLLIIYETSITSKNTCVTNDRQDPNGVTDVGYYLLHMQQVCSPDPRDASFVAVWNLMWISGWSAVVASKRPTNCLVVYPRSM